MFLYLVALVATIFLIFGLAYAGPSNESLRASIGNPLNLYRNLNYGRTNDLGTQRSFAEISEASEYGTPAGEMQEVLVGNTENFGEVMKDDRSKNLGSLNFSLENLVKKEIEKDRNLPDATFTKQFNSSVRYVTLNPTSGKEKENNRGLQKTEQPSPSSLNRDRVVEGT